MSEETMQTQEVEKEVEKRAGKSAKKFDFFKIFDVKVFEYTIGQLMMFVIFCAFCGFMVENIGRTIDQGIFDGRYMFLPFIFGYGIGVLIAYLALGRPSGFRIFSVRILKEDTKKKQGYTLSALLSHRVHYNNYERMGVRNARRGGYGAETLELFEYVGTHRQVREFADEFRLFVGRIRRNGISYAAAHETIRKNIEQSDARHCVYASVFNVCGHYVYDDKTFRNARFDSALENSFPVGERESGGNSDCVTIRTRQNAITHGYPIKRNLKR